MDQYDEKKSVILIVISHVNLDNFEKKATKICIITKKYYYFELKQLNINFCWRPFVEILHIKELIKGLIKVIGPPCGLWSKDGHLLIAVI